MKQLVKKTEELILVSFVTGLTVFILSIATVILWKRDGFDLLETSLMSMLSGIYFLVITIIANIISLNKYIRSSIKNNMAPIKRFFQVLIVLGVSFLIFLIFDTVFFLIDNSISKDYANALVELAEKSGSSLDTNTLENFAKLPFALQNGIVTFILAFIGSMISLLFVKKDGILFT